MHFDLGTNMRELITKLRKAPSRMSHIKPFNYEEAEKLRQEREEEKVREHYSSTAHMFVTNLDPLSLIPRLLT